MSNGAAEYITNQWNGEEAETFYLYWVAADNCIIIELDRQ